MSTLTQMQTSLRTYIGNPTTGSVADSVLTEHLNRAYRRIADENKLPQTIDRTSFNTVLGTSTYNLTTNATHVIKIWNRTLGCILNPIDPPILNEFDDADNENQQNGRPTNWYRSSGSLVLFPTPDAVYKIEVVSKVKPAVLVTGSDTPVLDELWHDGIVLLARWYYFDSVMDYPKAQYAYGVWQSWLQTKPNELHQESVAFDEAVNMPIFSQGGSMRRRRNFDF